MNVGVYIDGFNLYYGLTRQFGPVTRGWKWIDLRAVATARAGWPGSVVSRVVYCTAKVNDPDDQAQTQRQQHYLAALAQSGAVDLIELGYFNSWAKESAMTVEGPGTRNPTLLRDQMKNETWSGGLHIRRTSADGVLLATVRKREEKGSDVNVAAHLLNDVLTGAVQAAIVISNDSDLGLPIKMARAHVPVGVLNPGTNAVAGALKGSPNDSVGGHWWGTLTTADILAAQLPNPVAGIARPATW